MAAGMKEAATSLSCGSVNIWPANSQLIMLVIQIVCFLLVFLISLMLPFQDCTYLIEVLILRPRVVRWQFRGLFLGFGFNFCLV